jgi:hypothetical protein
MSFDQRFQLAEAIPAEIGKQDCMLSGRQLATDRPVTIHLLAGGYNDANNDLLHAIATLPPDYRVCFLETGEFQGIPYVVTDVVAGNPPLREWIATVREKMEQAKELKKAGQWKIPDWAKQGGTPPPEVAASPVPSAPPPRQEPPPAVDEFSLMLGEPTPSAPSAQPGRNHRGIPHQRAAASTGIERARRVRCDARRRGD